MITAAKLTKPTINLSRKHRQSVVLLSLGIYYRDWFLRKSCWPSQVVQVTHFCLPVVTRQGPTYEGVQGGDQIALSLSLPSLSDALPYANYPLRPFNSPLSSSLVPGGHLDNEQKHNSGSNPIFSTFWKIIAETNFTQIKRPDMWRSGCHRDGYYRLYCFVKWTSWNFVDFKETTVGIPSSFKASWHTVVTFSIKPFLVHPYSVYVLENITWALIL